MRLAAGLIGLAATLPGHVAASASASVEPRPVEPGGLAAAIRAAAPGAVIELAAGQFVGPFRIEKPLEVRGAGEATVIAGSGEGSVITVDAPDVVLRDLTVRGSGTSLFDEDSGIFLTERARHARVEGNRILGNLVGVSIKGAREAAIRRNVIHGRRDLRMNERGNGVHVWNAPGAVVEDNEIRYGRDGIFVTTSRENRFAGNSFQDLRFGVHYMYTQQSVVEENTSYGNHVGYALMYSKKIEARNNLSHGDRDRGILLNYVNDSSVEGNAVVDGGEKCVFLYNSNVNSFRGNWFEGCEIGIHFTAGSERNEIAGNAFIGNRTQVKYVGTRLLNWSAGGRGQYWSDNPAFDLDGDGIADQPYRPNDVVDQVVWAHPVAKLLLNGPAVTVLRYAQARLPSLYPGGVVDTAPLMRPPEIPARRRAADAERP